ncbi:MAG: NAD-dependent epimerase/dehydratase family protein, partial [Actinobacteria bacterium]
MEAVGLSGRSALVTGAYGLLGSWLVKGLLERGARVCVVRRDRPALTALESMGLGSRVDVVEGDVCSEGLVL